MVDYLDLGSEIDYPTYNAIVYLLRKFKRLTNDLRLGQSVINTDYGTLSFTGGLTSLGENFIIESPVTVSANDCLRNCFYSLHFTVIDRNLSGTVNRRVATVTGNTGETGELEITIPTTLLESDEVILPDFKLDIVLDPHEYYTEVTDLSVQLEVDEQLVRVGETATVTATIKLGDELPVTNTSIVFNVNGVEYTRVTDEDGVATFQYTETGNTGEVTVTVFNKSVVFYGGNHITSITCSGTEIDIGYPYNQNIQWLYTNGDVTILWGDGTQDIVNNPNTKLFHTYTDGETIHEILFIGEVTSITGYAFYQRSYLLTVDIGDTVTYVGGDTFAYCSNLTEVNLPDSVTSLGQFAFSGDTSLTEIKLPNNLKTIPNQCFKNCTSLTSVSIPEGVTTLEFYSFSYCTNLAEIYIPYTVTSIGVNFYNSGVLDYELYWGNNPIAYDSNKMPAGNNTIFTIPYGSTQAYVDAGYPSAKLVERDEGTPTYFKFKGDKPIITVGEVETLTARLTDENHSPSAGETVEFYKSIPDTDWTLVVTATKDIIQSTETTTITATVTDENGDPVENILIDFYKGE